MMLPILLLLAAAPVGRDFDPWDEHKNPLSVNDSEPKASSEPSFLGVAFCLGASQDAQPVLIMDRLCLNHAAADLLAGEIQSDRQQIKADAEIQRKLAKAIDADDKTIKFMLFLCVVIYLAGIMVGRAMRRKA
jgi:hypothetical protein